MTLLRIRSSRNVAPIYLTHVSSHPAYVKLRLSPHGQHAEQRVRWLFLGRDYLKMCAWELSLGQGFERIQYTRELQNIGNQWRRPYLDWIADLGKVHNGLEWWSSRIAERNTQLYSLFHDLCYLHIARSFASCTDSPLLIVAESKALLRIISFQAELKERIRWIARPLLVGEWGLWMLRMVFVWTRYIARGLLELRDAKRTKKSTKYQSSLPLTSNKVRVLIHSCMDENYFNRENGSAHDRYFTVLPEELRRQGYDVVVIPWLFNLQRSRRETFRWFRQQSDQYLIPEDYSVCVCVRERETERQRDFD